MIWIVEGLGKERPDRFGSTSTTALSCSKPGFRDVITWKKVWGLGSGTWVNLAAKPDQPREGAGWGKGEEGPDPQVWNVGLAGPSHCGPQSREEHHDIPMWQEPCCAVWTGKGGGREMSQGSREASLGSIAPQPDSQHQSPLCHPVAGRLWAGDLTWVTGSFVRWGWYDVYLTGFLWWNEF